MGIEKPLADRQQIGRREGIVVIFLGPFLIAVCPADMDVDHLHPDQLGEQTLIGQLPYGVLNNYRPRRSEDIELAGWKLRLEFAF